MSKPFTCHRRKRSPVSASEISVSLSALCLFAQHLQVLAFLLHRRSRWLLFTPPYSSASMGSIKDSSSARHYPLSSVRARQIEVFATTPAITHADWKTSDN